MPIKKIPQLTSWSYSRWSLYEQCPFKAKCKHIDRLPEPGNKAMSRGGDIHKTAEKVVLEKKMAIPPELARFGQEFKDVRKIRGVETELDLAYTKDWEPCESTDWDYAWVRIKIDLIIPPQKGVLEVIDHKTGKAKPVYAPQLELYALGGLLRYPQAVSARARLWYLDEGVIYPSKAKEGIYLQSKVPAMKKMWEKRVVPMLNDTKFAPRPGNYCTWCHYRKANGGPCKF